LDKDSAPIKSAQDSGLARPGSDQRKLARPRLDGVKSKRSAEMRLEFLHTFFSRKKYERKNETARSQTKSRNLSGNFCNTFFQEKSVKRENW
jgi:hypothetical protein